MNILAEVFINANVLEWTIFSILRSRKCHNFIQLCLECWIQITQSSGGYRHEKEEKLLFIDDIIFLENIDR